MSLEERLAETGNNFTIQRCSVKQKFKRITKFMVKRENILLAVFQCPKKESSFQLDESHEFVPISPGRSYALRSFANGQKLNMLIEFSRATVCEECPRRVHIKFYGQNKMPSDFYSMSDIESVFYPNFYIPSYMNAALKASGSKDPSIFLRVTNLDSLEISSSYSISCIQATAIGIAEFMASRLQRIKI